MPSKETAVKIRSSRVSALAACSVAAALVLSACGSDSGTKDSGSDSGSSKKPDSKLAGNLTGAGSTAQQSAQDAWKASFTKDNSNVQVSYEGIGSGGGRTNFTQGSVMFAGSDGAMKPEEIAAAQARCNGGAAIDVPDYVSPIAVVFNVKGVKDLKLSPDVISGIFMGQITSWDDAKIKADNPDAKLPTEPIIPVHRSDDSGTTKNFTDYLNKTAPSVWTTPAGDTFPVQGGQSGKGTSGLIQVVQGAEGTIGYADMSQAGSLGMAQIKVGDAWVKPSADAAAKAVDASPQDSSRAEGDIVVQIDRTTTEKGAYPLVLVSYFIACNTYATKADADNVKAYLTYITSKEGQQVAADAAGSAPLSDKLSQQAKKSADSIKVKG